MRLQIASSLLLLAFSTAIMAAEQTALSDKADRINYSIGHQIGSDFVKQQVELDETSLRQGLSDGNQSIVPRLDRKEMGNLLSNLKRNITSDMREKALAQMKTRQEKTERIRNEGQAFLDQNREKEGVIVLPSGLQYKVLTPASGPKPGPRDTVTMHFRSRTIEGKEYNSSYKQDTPYSAKVSQLFKGFSEAVQLMSPGAKWELYLPPELAYGRRGPLAHHTIIIETELLSINTPADEQASSGSPMPAE